MRGARVLDPFQGQHFAPDPLLRAPGLENGPRRPTRRKGIGIETNTRQKYGTNRAQFGSIIRGWTDLLP